MIKRDDRLIVSAKVTTFINDQRSILSVYVNLISTDCCKLEGIDKQLIRGTYFYNGGHDLFGGRLRPRDVRRIFECPL